MMISFELRTILVFLTAFFATLFVLPKLANIAHRIGLVDHPNERKVHKTPRPLVGGIGMMISATFSALILIPIGGLRGYFLGVALLLLIGFFDDFREIGHRQKFIAQILATALLIYFSKVSLVSFGDLVGLGNIDLSGSRLLVWAVTVFCVVGVINAINMIDGLDGLAGGISFLAFLTFAIHASLIGNQNLMLLNLALAGAVLGFLNYNWAPSTLFMGDAGSLCLGFSLAFMSLAITQGDGVKVSPVVPLLILAVPITDTVFVMTKRIFRGESPFKPDKYHLHHIFLRYGMGRVGAVKVILGLSGVLCVSSLLGQIKKFSDYSLFLIYVGYALTYVLSSLYIVWLFRHGGKLKVREGQSRRGIKLFESVTQHFHLFHIFRKSPRYDVHLQIECYAREVGKVFRGTALNISTDGLMACIADLDRIYENMLVKIIFPLDSDAHSIELPAEHLWLHDRDGQLYHGFRFLGFDGMQKQVIFKFLVEYKKNP